MTVLGVKTEVNLNTIAIIAGFLATFATIVYSWARVENQQEDINQWIAQHMALHSQLDSDRNSKWSSIQIDLQRLHAVDAARDTQVAEMAFRIGANEKGIDANSLRINRMAESYADQFSDIRNKLNSIETQVALTNQVLQGLKTDGHTIPLNSQPQSQGSNR